MLTLNQNFDCVIYWKLKSFDMKNPKSTIFTLKNQNFDKKSKLTNDNINWCSYIYSFRI